MTWVDTHCHLHLSGDPAEGLLERAAAVGVEWVVCPGTDLETSKTSISLAEQYPDTVLSTAGLHPHEAEQWPAQEQGIVELAASVSAIGECGLDFYRNLASRQAQMEAFRAQLALAIEVDKPVIVHCRDAFQEVYEAVVDMDVAERVVLHCWTGGPKWTKRFRELPVTFSFAGPVAFDTGDTVRRGAAEAPPERTMVETDTPYLTPPPHRHAANEPANVVAVGAALAEVWGMTIDEVASLTTATATRVFRA